VHAGRSAGGHGEMRGTERWRRMRLGVATQRTAKAQGADRRAPSPNPLPAPGQGLIPRSPALPPPPWVRPPPPLAKKGLRRPTAMQARCRCPPAQTCACERGAGCATPTLPAPPAPAEGPAGAPSRPHPSSRCHFPSLPPPRLPPSPSLAATSSTGAACSASRTAAARSVPAASRCWSPSALTGAARTPSHEAGTPPPDVPGGVRPAARSAPPRRLRGAPRQARRN
jgi:hypothetical protein